MSYIGKTPTSVPLTSSDIEDGIISTDKLAANAVVTSKITDATISNADVNATLVTGQTAETSIADGDTILIHDASASALRKMTKANFVSGIGGANTPIVRAVPSGNQAISSSTNTTVVFNTEVIDTDSKYDNSSNYRFTPTVAGNYMVFMNLYIASGSGALQHGTIKLYKNGSELSFSRTSHRSNHGEAVALSWSGIVPLDSDDYIEMYGQGEGGGQASYFKGGSAQQASSFGAFKIVE